jgi:hypothetical protein
MQSVTALRLAPFLPRRIFPGVRVGNRHTGAGQQALAELGQHHAAAGAVKQPPADAALQRRELPAQRGLRDADDGGGARVAAIGGNLDESPELADVHP